MQKINEYQYSFSIYSDSKFRESQYLDEEQLVIKNISNIDCPFYERNRDTKSIAFYADTVLCDFFDSGAIKNDPYYIKEAQAIEFLGCDYSKYKTLEEFTRAMHSIPTHHIKNAPVTLSDNIYKNPIFMGCEFPSNVCPSKEEAEKLWKILNTILIDTNNLFNVSLGDFDIMRSQYQADFTCIVEAPVHCKEWNDYRKQSKKLIYHYKCKNSRGILFALLHYYISNNYIFKKCKLCGKHFITKKHQENFCNREFSYINWNNETKKYRNCKEARKLIKQSLAARKKKIGDLLEKRIEREGIPFSELTTNEDIEYACKNYTANRDFKVFNDTCEKYIDSIKLNPSIENFKEYEKYLYIDCERYYKRYSRI